MSGCVASGSPEGVPPNPLNASTGPFLKLPDKLDIYATLAAPENTFSPTVGRAVKILMVGDGTMRVTTDGATPALSDPALIVPKRGVVHVLSNNPTPALPLNPPNVLEIQGVGSDVTFVSEDDLKVTGDIKQPPLTPGVTLGFVAGGSITINQPTLGLQNIRVVFVDERSTNEPGRVLFTRTEMPVPFGRIRFQDLTYLPGTLTFDFFGHEVELLPRVLTINLQERQWQSGATYFLSATNKVPGLKDRDRKGRR